MTPGGDTIELTRLSEVEPEEVRWLWPGRIPLGKLTILDGDPGTGKTTLALDLAARVSRGSPMPDGAKPDYDGPQGVVILTAEDGLADTIRPRLDAADADVEQITSPGVIHEEDGGERLPTVEDKEAIRTAIQEVSAALVVLDPLAAYLGAEVDSHRDASVRGALRGLAQVAEETATAVLAIRHLNKAQDLKAMYRGGGSIAFTASARSVLLAAPHPDDPNGDQGVLASIKCNLAPPQESLEYRSVTEEHGAVRIDWLGTSGHSAENLLVNRSGTAKSKGGKRERAKEWLRYQLADGPVESRELKRRVEHQPFSWKTVGRAAEELGIDKEKNGFDGGWVWQLPTEVREKLADFDSETAQNPGGEAPSPKTSNPDELDHLRGNDAPSKTANRDQIDHLQDDPESEGILNDSKAEDGHDFSPEGPVEEKSGSSREVSRSGLATIPKKHVDGGGSDDCSHG